MKHLLILSLILVAVADTAAEEIQSMSAILPSIQSDTLVLFDVDDTLIRPAQYPSETAWGRALLSQLRDAGHSEDEIRRELWNRLYLARACGPMRAVEPTTPKLIADLQARKIAVMGLTARSPELAWITHHQLTCLGIYLTRTAPICDSVCLLPSAACAGYTNGILYTARADKGVALEALLQATDLRPAHIIMVDDRLERVQQVEAAARRLDIPCLGYHYTRTHHARKRHTPLVPAADLSESNGQGDPPPIRRAA